MVAERLGGGWGEGGSKIHLRAPKRYQKTYERDGEGEWEAPSLEWLERTWTVTHSTLPMWRKAKNVRITYKILRPEREGEGGVVVLDDTVESEPTEKTWMPQPKAIHGIDTPDPSTPAAWNWRGKGLLKIASSHWEVLGWGEREGERWVVTWFAPSLFTPAGVDVYSDRKEGGSEGLVKEVLGALEEMECVEVSGVCKQEMRAVKLD
ncbi:hypothetical protein BDZ45DRAFT_582855 [Acephala macrosclerotiorum]|nr:hypothetical protein BDZ45DRAFT_582855 [Acephala macrosclerotiorum]